MKILVAIIAILIVVSAEDEADEDAYGPDEDYFDPDDDDYGSIIDHNSMMTKEVKWTGNVKKLVDTAQLEPKTILSITKRIFKNTRINCNGTMGMPTQKFLPSPTAECDLTSMDDLRAAVSNPQSFNSDIFLKTFWSSSVGGQLLKEIKKKKVKEAVIKAAMKETWFNRTSYRDTAFNRLFLATNINGLGRLKKFNTWYTFDVAKQNISECYSTSIGNEPPVAVSGNCIGFATYSWFIYPSHPFVDLLLYTLCVWIKNPEKGNSQKCLVASPGSKKLFMIKQNIYTDRHNISFVANVYPVYCEKQGINKGNCDHSSSRKSV